MRARRSESRAARELDHDVGELLAAVLLQEVAGALEARVLTAQRLESGHWMTIGTYSDETEARIAPFDAVPLDVASWWPPAAP